MKIRSFTAQFILLATLVSTSVTAATPTVTTSSPTDVTGGSARLRGSANPNGAATTAWFRYDTTDPGTCNDSFGTRTPVHGGAGLGSGTSGVQYTRFINELTTGTPYYYCAIAENVDGIAFGSVVTFTTHDAPTVATDPATDVTSSSATFNGTATPNGFASYGFFRFSTTNPGACDDSFGTRSNVPDANLGSGSSPIAFSYSGDGLLPGTTYYVCALGRNIYGTTWGSVQSFTTGAEIPSTATFSADQLTGTTAELNGWANPNGAATTGWFRYDTVDPGTCNDSFGTRAPASGGNPLGSGADPVVFSESISGLTTGTPTYFCAIAENAEGFGFGSILSFTPDDAPAVSSTSPADGAIDVAMDADITITFTEEVTVQNWYTILCDTTGYHLAAESGGPITYTLNPDTDFVPDELCTVTIYSFNVADDDDFDPPDTMADNYVFSFTPGVNIFSDDFESGDTSAWTSTAP